MSVEVHYRLLNGDVPHVLTHDEWLALEAAGWTIDWDHRVPVMRTRRPIEGPRTASKWFEGDLREVREQAIAEWEAITGRRAETWATCDCCPDPHDFSFTAHAAALRAA